MVAPSHFAAFDENSATAAACAMVVSFATCVIGRAYKIHNADAHVDDADQQDSQQHRARQNLLRILDLAGNPGDVNPTIEGPEHRDQRNAKA